MLKKILKSSQQVRQEREAQIKDTACPECGGMSMPLSRTYRKHQYRCCNMSCRCEWEMKDS